MVEAKGRAFLDQQWEHWWTSYGINLVMDPDYVEAALAGIEECWRLFGTAGVSGASLGEFQSAEIQARRSGGLRSFAEDHNDFTLALCGQLLQTPGNLFFSPLSIRTALAMTCAGARGETAAQMSEALRFASSNESLQIALAEMIRTLNTGGGGRYEMAVANSLWGQEGAPLQTGFLDLVTRHYGGGMNVVDFRRDAEAARARINRWVEDKTKQKIRELIASDGLSCDTRLVLVNAVYFKGIWELQFHKATTDDKPFYLESGSKVQASLMHQSEEVRYLQVGGFQAVDLDYRGGDLSMLVLLPDRKDGLRDLEKTLSARMLHDCVAQMGTREIKLFLPRFKITWGTVNVSDHLTALGMPLAFTRLQANFSGINGHEPPHEDSLFISAVFHKAFVETNEEGTEAAAATAVAITSSSAMYPSKPPPVPIFRADHPFLFAIRDRKSGAILFLGRMADPRRES
jgi:serpin B